MSIIPEAVCVPGQDADDLILTENQLRTYVDTHAQRHAPREGGTCACGWPHVRPELLDAWRDSTAFHTQAQHAQAVLTGALGDLLPSDTSAKNDHGQMAPVPWRVLVKHLYDEIDVRDRSIDPRLVTLMRWCLNEGHADVADLARITVMHPSYLARLLNVQPPNTGDETTLDAP
jgi:hypothetical protein